MEKSSTDEVTQVAGKTFVISDPHFRHSNVINFGKRPFNSIQEMEENICELWNMTVSKRDTVLILGDWGMSKQAYSIADRLNGYKRLIMGNHDYGDLHKLSKHFSTVHGSLQKGDILFTHMPVIMDYYRRYKYIVHGHIHDPTQNIDDYRYYNVNMDAIGYYGPISLEEIRETLRQREVEHLFRGEKDGNA